MNKNYYLPELAEIIEIKDEVIGSRAIKSFKTRFVNGKQSNEENNFIFKSGQCVMISAFGKGESMISISSSPFVKDFLQFTILKSGRVTTSLHEMALGDIIGLRGPFGSSFPIEEWKGRNLIFIAGGIGLAPMWSVLNTALDKRDEYGDLMLIYGARTSNDLIYKNELRELKKNMTVHLSIDKEEPDWNEFVGFVPQNVKDKVLWPQNSIAVTCGPPVMIKYVIQELKNMKFEDDRIFTTIENKMKCGIGKCGRCNIGSHYVCKDGPVYSWGKLKTLPQEY